MFESADTPHIVTPAGIVYVRTSKGKEPVREQSQLLALANRGADARAKAMRRMDAEALPMITDAVGGNAGVPDGPGSLVIVRVAPFTVTPQFSDWALTEAAAETLEERIALFAEAFGGGDRVRSRVDIVVEPFGRGRGRARGRDLAPRADDRAAREA